MKLFLWPTTNILTFIKNIFFFKNHTHVELLLNKYYKGGYPVLCNSARVGIKLILEKENLNKKELVQIFPYASQCVVEAVGFSSTPYCAIQNYENENYKILYNQWGYRNSNLSSSKNYIDDCADSLVDIDTNIFFDTKSKFIIWSLPKIISSLSGGIIWCKNKEDAVYLNKKIHSNKGSYFLLLIKFLLLYSGSLYKIWNLKIYKNPNLTILETSDIYSRLKNLKEIIEDRKNKIKLFKKYLPIKYELSSKYLPCVIPLTNGDFKKYELFMNSYCGVRHFYDRNKKVFLKTYPLPIHQDVSVSKLLKFKAKFL